MEPKTEKTKTMFNLSFCKLSNVNIRYFLNLIDKYFDHNNHLQKGFNRKILKCS